MDLENYRTEGALADAEASLEHPADFAYFGDLEESDGWGRAFGQHRDSDALDRSNWQVISEDMASRFPDYWQVESASHWAVGWTEGGRVKVLEDASLGITLANLTEAFLACLEWKAALEDYPVADEEAYSALEYAEFCEFLEAEESTLWQPIADRFYAKTGQDFQPPDGFLSALISRCLDYGSRADDLRWQDMEASAEEVWTEHVASLRAAWQFFQAKAGGIVGQSAKTALALAKAEAGLADAVYCGLARIIWQPEEAADTSWMDTKALKAWQDGSVECLWASVQTREDSASEDWQTAASLGGIFLYADGEADYRRIVEAELAAEAGYGSDHSTEGGSNG
jgi:hypothetical protein